MMSSISRRILIFFNVAEDGAVTIYAGKSVAVGWDDFNEIVNRGFSLVDKTLLVEDFLR